MTQFTRAEFLAVLTGGFALSQADCTLPKSESSIKVEKQFSYNGLQFEFRGWDLYLTSKELEKFQRVSPGSQLVVRSNELTDDIDRKDKVFSFSKGSPPICRTNIDLSFASPAGDIVFKLVPPLTKGDIRFTLYTEQKSGNQIQAQQFSYAPPIYSYGNESVISEKSIPETLQRQILAIRNIWAPLGNVPPMYLVNWGNGVRFDNEGVFLEIGWAGKLIGYEENIMFVLNEILGGEISQTAFNGVMYHELGHWLYSSVLSTQHRTSLDDAYRQLGGRKQIGNFQSFTEQTYGLYGGHPQDEATELCASMCAILKYSPDYVSRLSGLDPSIRRIHKIIQTAILQGIANFSNESVLAGIFPNYRAILSSK